MGRLLVPLLMFAVTFAGAASKADVSGKCRVSTSPPLATDNATSISIYSFTAASSSSSTESNATDSSSENGDDESADSIDSSSGAEEFTIGSAANVSTIESTHINWVGTALDTSSTTACYREAHIAGTCPTGFNSDLGTCWAQCPYSYPAQCGLECIRQNDDCALEVVSKVSVVAQSALSFATLGLYGDFKLMAQGLQVAIKCSKDMLGLIKSLAKYVRSIHVSDPQTSQDKLLAILYQSDNVVIDIPVTVASCLGIKVDDSVKFADKVLTTAELTLKEVLANGDAIVSSWDSFTAFMTNLTLGDSISSMNETDISSLKSAMESNSTCGYDMKRLLDRTWMTVADLRRQNPEISEDDIRVAMSESSLALNDIPVATNNCMDEFIAQSDESTAYATRDTLRKTFAGIMDDLISSGTSSNGSLLSAEEYAFKVADKAVAFYAVWDVWGVAGTVSEYFQPICGPTALIGEIDDGTATEALGMSIVQEAFNGSDGTWTKIGDGTVTVTFTSADTEDVTVNINSGGDEIAEVAVAAGETVTWISNVTALGGKTLYLDRWRPGLLGLPGTGGGSLLLWVPRSTQGGSLALTAKLNES